MNDPKSPEEGAVRGRTSQRSVRLRALLIVLPIMLGVSVLYRAVGAPAALAGMIVFYVLFFAGFLVVRKRQKTKQADNEIHPEQDPGQH